MTTINDTAASHATTPGEDTSEGKLARLVVTLLAALAGLAVVAGLINQAAADALMANVEPIIGHIAEIVAWYIGGRSGLKAAAMLRKG